MSVENIYICDRCNKESRTDRSWWLTLKSISYEYDLCPECKAKFLAFIKEKK